MAQPFPAAVPNYDQGGSHDALRTGSVSSMPDSVQSSALPAPGAPAVRHAAAAQNARDAARPGGWSAGDGTHVALRSGETIYTLSRRYGVPADAIMKANGISKASDVAAGRDILIPTYNYSRSAPVSAPDHDPRTRQASASPARRPEPDAPQKTAMLSADARGNDSHRPGQVSAANDAGSGQSYVVQSGDTLSRIASRNGVSIDALKRANNLSGTAIRIGQRLELPHGGAVAAHAAPEKSPPTNEVTTASVPARSEPEPKHEKVVAAATPDVSEPKPRSYTPPADKSDSVAEAQKQTKVATATPQSSGIGKLRWPLQGQVVSKFGAMDDGRRNDGIDISVPEGSSVKAAENGVVIYAGNGLKEYGNTVLIRHDDGLVTVYGYAKDLKVSRGDKVTRGEVIADSGMTGAATRPTLHFEVRKDAKPVDPMSFLD